MYLLVVNCSNQLLPSMPANPSKLPQFWQELKRRSVIRVMAMYAATAFIMIEATDIILPRLGLPDWTVTFIIILLIVGFPITIILSWIFDITPEGIKKTDAVQAHGKSEDMKTTGIPSSKRQFKSSDGIIMILVTVVCILLYPKIFKKDQFEQIRDEDGRISIVVMPFQNLISDSLYTDFGWGLQNILITKLSNSKELSVRPSSTVAEILSNSGNLNYASITQRFAKDIARKLDANTVIQGGINKYGPVFRITANLTDAETGEVYQSFEIDCDSESEVLTVSDSLSILLKNFLEIKALEKDMNEELRSFAETGSAEAYMYFAKGLNKFWKGDYADASGFFEKALEIDPGFFSAAMFLIPTYGNMNKPLKSREISEALMKHLEQCTYGEEVTIKFWHSNFNRDFEESIRYARLIVEENPMQRTWWYELGRQYGITKQYTEALEAYEKALELDASWGGGWKWFWGYLAPAHIYHRLGKHKREKELYALCLQAQPGHPEIIVCSAICDLSQGDTISGNQKLSEFKRICSERGWPDSKVKRLLSSYYWNMGHIEEAARQYELAIETEAPDYNTYWAMAEYALMLTIHDLDIKKGLQLTESLLLTEPNNKTMLGYLYHAKGLGLHKNGKYHEALDYLQKSQNLIDFLSWERSHMIREIEQILAAQQR